MSTMIEPLKKVIISGRNSVQNVWFCDRQQEWRWCLIWEDGSKHGTHMHSGTAPDREKAMADIATTVSWVEAKWPTEEYFQGA